MSVSMFELYSHDIGGDTIIVCFRFDAQRVYILKLYSLTKEKRIYKAKLESEPSSSVNFCTYLAKVCQEYIFDFKDEGSLCKI